MAAEENLLVSLLKVDLTDSFNERIVPQLFERRFTEITNLQFFGDIHATGHNVSVPGDIQKFPELSTGKSFSPINLFFFSYPLPVLQRYGYL